MSAVTDTEMIPAGIAEYFDTVAPREDLEQRLDPNLLARLGNIQRLKTHSVLANNS